MTMIFEIILITYQLIIRLFETEIKLLIPAQTENGIINMNRYC